MVVFQIYDRHFDLNEWFVLAMIVGGFSVIYLLPKIIPVISMIFGFLFGPFLGLVFDHTLAVPPLDLYDVGDRSSYEIFDIFSYMMYAPFGYLFIYFFEKFNIKGLWSIFYIIGWKILSLLLEWACVKIGIFHYKHGYMLPYSIPVYLFVQSQLFVIYRYFFKNACKGVKT